MSAPLCPGGGLVVERITKVCMDRLGTTLRSAKCPLCGRRCLVLYGKLIEHPEPEQRRAA